VEEPFFGPKASQAIGKGSVENFTK